MRERAINLRDWEVRAILDGRKTMIRWPVKLREFQRSDTAGYDFTFRDRRYLWNDFREDDLVSSKFNPFGATGDLLWVRECWLLNSLGGSSLNGVGTWTYEVAYRAGGHSLQLVHSGEDAADPYGPYYRFPEPWRSSTQTPRWASRLTLRVTDVRVERVQDITEEDARAEGFDGDCPVGYLPAYQAGPCRYHFASSWSDTYGAESWTANPWVWCVSFERAEVRRG